MIHALLLAAFANAPVDYAYVFPITSQDGAAAQRVDATPDVYRWSQDEQLGDVEIFNAAGKPVPMARVAAEATAASSEHFGELPTFALPVNESLRGDLNLVVVRDDSGHLRRIDERWHPTTPPREWLLDATGFTHAIDRLTLNWPTSNAVMRVSVEGSDDLQSWSFLTSGTVLSLEHSGTRIERHELPLAHVRAKYLRVRRLDDGAPVLELSANVQGVETGYELPARAWREATLAPIEKTPEVAARFTYSLDGAVPVDTVRVQFDNDNALANFELSARWNPADQWTRLGSLTAFRLNADGEALMNDEQRVMSRGRFREFRLESRAPVSQPPKLSVGYLPARFVFLAEGQSPWTLAAGSLKARSASWPISAALAMLRAKLGSDWQPPLASLGAPMTSAGDAAFHEPPPPTPWKQYVLWGVLLAGALVIAAFAFSLLRSSPEQPPPS